MFEKFDILSNLPLIILATLFLIVFILFLWAGIVLLISKGDPLRIQRGRKILLSGIYGFFITLVVVLVFYLVSYLIKKGEVFQPKEVFGEFPISPAINFPPGAQFVKISGYYFQGPWLLKDFNKIDRSAVFSILCKKNGDYDIIFIDIADREQLLKNKNFNCWMEKCGKNLKNLYVAVFWTHPEVREPTEGKQIKESIGSQIKPPCSSSVNE